MTAIFFGLLIGLEIKHFIADNHSLEIGVFAIYKPFKLVLILGSMSI